MLIGIVMLLFSMGLRPFMPYFLLVSILEFFNGAGSMIAYICPFIIRKLFNVFNYNITIKLIVYICNSSCSAIRNK